MSEPQLGPLALAYLAQYPLEAAQLLPASDVQDCRQSTGRIYTFVTR